MWKELKWTHCQTVHSMSNDHLFSRFVCFFWQTECNDGKREKAKNVDRIFRFKAIGRNKDAFYQKTMLNYVWITVFRAFDAHLKNGNIFANE